LTEIQYNNIIFKKEIIKYFWRLIKMIDLKELNKSYITDEIGKKTAVVLPISIFEELMEDINDLAIVAERRNEKNISHDELKKELGKDGIL
jgi:hypothetical protein